MVLKFGGTSVSSVPNWHNIAAVLRQRKDEGLRPVVVHSAISGITVIERAELVEAEGCDRTGSVRRGLDDRVVGDDDHAV